MSAAGVVVCPQPMAAEAGVDVLANGGNAVDAAVAVAFVQTVIDPPMAGLGGFGTMLYRDGESGEVHCLDFPARAGSATTPDQWVAHAGSGLADRFGYSVEGLLNDIGYESVAVPGTVEGFGSAHERWGSIPWIDVVAPAIAAAADGVPVSTSTRDFWLEPAAPGRATGYERMTATPAASELFAPGGELLAVGELLRQPELAHTLETIAGEGHRSFYEGEIAAQIAADFAANGGHVTGEDLAGYRAELRDPLSSTYRDWLVLGAPPPSGGVMIGQMLHLLERFDLGADTHNSARNLALLVEAMKYAIHCRTEAGPEPPAQMVGAMLDRDHVDPFVGTVQAGGKIEVTPLPDYEAATTTHVTVADSSGGIVSLTHSLGYGSGVVTPGLGFLFNNYMNVFNPYPGHPDSIAPGKRRSSSIAPTIVLDSGGEPVAALGAPGATRITTGLLQSMLNFLDFRMTPVEAVSAPRVDCQGQTVECENRIPGLILERLAHEGYGVSRREKNYDPYFARVQMIARVDDGWVGASDPRRDGGAAMYQPHKEDPMGLPV